MNRITYIAVWLVCLLCLSPAYGQRLLSNEATISVLTSAPYEGEVFTVYGHAAFRVHDPAQELDVIFNYGIFDFSKPNFIYRFAIGQTDYRVMAVDYLGYIAEYQMRGSDITEQVLDLQQDEKDRIWQALIVNLQPENAVYRYNFFFDNCATRLPAIVEKYIDGKVIYNDPPTPLTFRDMINYCTRNHPWLTFGCDLVLGSPTDRMATAHEMMFLPDYLKAELAKATVARTDGTERKLVSSTSVIDTVEVTDDGFNWLNIFTPLVCSWLFFALIAAITYIEWRKKKNYRLIDILLFTVAGLAGCVLFFLSFISTHPCIWPNWSVVWLHPFHLIAAILICFNVRKAVFYYHFINFAALLLFLIGWYFIPQHLNTAFIPLILTLLLRSWHGICTYTKKIG